LSTIKVQSLSNKLVEVAVIAAVLVVFLIAMQFAYGQSAGSLENQTNQTIVNETNVTDYT
jgi:cell division protein FtsN